MPRPIRNNAGARSSLAKLYDRLVLLARESLEQSEAHPPIEPELYPQDVLQRPARDRIAAADAGEPITVYWFQLPRDHRYDYPEERYLLYPDGGLIVRR